MSEVIPINAKALAAKEAMMGKSFPQETLLPLLDAPLDDLVTYLAPDSWEVRKKFLAGMMCGSIKGIVKLLEHFEKEGQSESETQAIMGSYMVGMHIKIGQLLDALGATKPADKHAAALFVLSASREHRMALSKWMPGGTSSPPEENKLFEPGSPLMTFKNMSLALRPGLSECWRDETGEPRP